MAPKRQAPEENLGRSGRFRVSSEGPLYIDLEDVDHSSSDGEDAHQGISDVSSPEKKQTRPAARGVVIREPQPESHAQPSVTAGKGKETAYKGFMNREDLALKCLAASIRLKHGLEPEGTSSAGPSNPPPVDKRERSSRVPEGPPPETTPGSSSQKPDSGSLLDEENELLLSRLDTMIALFQRHKLFKKAKKMDAERAEFVKEYREVLDLAAKPSSPAAQAPDDTDDDTGDTDHD